MAHDTLTQHYTDLNHLCQVNDWPELERHFYQLALSCAGAAIADEIQAVDLQPYTAAVARFLNEKLAEMSFHGIKGLLYEYAPAAAWRGTLFVSDRYNPAHAGSEAWARQPFHSAAGPRLPEFARLYQQYAGLDPANASRVAASFYLFARTTAAFGLAVGNAPLTRAAICIGHAGQPLLSRVYEHPSYALNG
jgi:hypothetical protein